MKSGADLLFKLLARADEKPKRDPVPEVKVSNEALSSPFASTSLDLFSKQRRLALKALEPRTDLSLRKSFFFSCLPKAKALSSDIISARALSRFPKSRSLRFNWARATSLKASYLRKTAP